jgi:hypothetical protein
MAVTGELLYSVKISSTVKNVSNKKSTYILCYAQIPLYDKQLKKYNSSEVSYKGVIVN